MHESPVIVFPPQISWETEPSTASSRQPTPTRSLGSKWEGRRFRKATLRDVARVVVISWLGVLALAGAKPSVAQSGAVSSENSSAADLIITDAKVTTLDPTMPEATTVAIRGGRFLAVGGTEVLGKHRGDSTRLVDAKGRRMIPGLIDAHMHLISYGATFNREIRWDGLQSLGAGLALVKEQVARTPPGQWVRVLGGWTPEQFTEQRLPTPRELEAVAPNTPVMITHLWDRIILNRAGLKALKIDRNTPAPAGGRFEKDRRGNPTGVIIAVSDWGVILGAMSKLPAPTELTERKSSTQRFMRVLNEYGVTSVIDAGAGAYPDNYAAIESLAKERKLTVRVAGTLYPPLGSNEGAQFARWLQSVKTDSQDPFFRIFGAGEIVSYAGFDMTNFGQKRPSLPRLEPELKPILAAIVKKGWPFSLHAAYDETITRLLNVIEEINAETPITQRWTIEHAETISSENIERINRLGGGIGVQSRILFQAEAFQARYRKTDAIGKLAPVREIIEKGVPVGFGTDSMRIASYNPWITPWFYVSGKSFSGRELLPPNKRLTRLDALRLATIGSAWFSSDEQTKGSIAAGKVADFALLSEDYFTVPEPHIRSLRSVLTVVDGRPVYGSGEYEDLAPPEPRVLPLWSPVPSKP